MQSDPIVFTIFLIFTGTAAVATLALYARQSLLVVYILLGILLGPSVLNLVSDPVLIRQMSHIGIIFLLFLLGINLQPQKLLHMLKESTLVAGATSILFLALGGVCAFLFGFNWTDSIVIGAPLSAKVHMRI